VIPKASGKIEKQRTQEVDDDAAVGAAACRGAEVGLAVGGLGEGDLRRPAVGAQVAGICDGVAEVEDGTVVVRRGEHPRRAEQGQHQRRRQRGTSNPNSAAPHGHDRHTLDADQFDHQYGTRSGRQSSQLAIGNGAAFACAKIAARQLSTAPCRAAKQSA